MAYRRFKRYFRRKYRKGSYSYRRSARRRYYRRRRRTGRNRRFPKSTEVKSIATKNNIAWEFNLLNNKTNNYFQNFYPLAFSIIGGEANPRFASNMAINIEPGTSQRQRIGNKIRPIKLRISGSMWLGSHSFVGVANPSTSVQGQTNIIMESTQPRSVQIRLMIYQVRGGNGNQYVNTQAYHSLALTQAENDDGTAEASPYGDFNSVRRLLMYYAHETQAENAGGTYTYQEMFENSCAGKTPLRLGIGGQFRMLYTKLFTMQTGYKSTIPFRFVTKVPRRMVWPEKEDGDIDEDAQPSCRNAIYIAWLIVPQSTDLYEPVGITYTTQLFFTDS